MMRKKRITAPEDVVAGNGLLHRRMFLTASTGAAAAVAGAALPHPAAADALPVEPWMKLPGPGFVGYGQPSKYEEKVARTWNTAPGTTGAGAARTPHQDVITWAINAKPSPCRS